MQPAVSLNYTVHYWKKKQKTKNKSDDSIHLLTGYEGNNTFNVPKVPTIIWGNVEENNWYRGENKGAITRISSL